MPTKPTPTFSLNPHQPGRLVQAIRRSLARGGQTQPVVLPAPRLVPAILDCGLLLADGSEYRARRLLSDVGGLLAEGQIDGRRWSICVEGWR